MSNPNPATPAAAPAAPAAPGIGEQTVTTPPATASTPTSGSGNSMQEGTVTIPVKEYRDLQRADARTKSFDRRYKKPVQAVNIDPNDPNADALAAAERGRLEAERRAMQAEVKGSVRELLAEDRFKSIPVSTKKLILESPHMLSTAETFEEAMFDIEDKLIEISSIDNIPVTIKPDNNTPSNRETPPIITPGTPAPVDSAVLEDTSNLRGVQRSTAVLRNAFKKKFPGKQ